MNEELKPCPFCGARVAELQFDVDAYPLDEGADVIGWYVDCDDGMGGGCRASGPVARTQEEAIADWNRRA